MRARVQQADEAVTADRKRVSARAVREALDVAGHRRLSADPRVRPGVEEEKSVAEAANRERPAVAADLDRAEELGSAVHDPVRFRRAQEGLEQIAPGLRRTVDRDRLTGEQERAVEVILDERLGAEALGELRGLRVARLAALVDREHPARDRRRQQDGDPGEQDAKAPVRAPSPLRLLLRGLAALGDELALELVDVECVIGSPVECGSEAGAAVELAPIAPCRVPFARRLGDVAAKPAPFGVLLDPLVQARPLAQQCLMGNLDASFRHGDEAAVGQRREHVGHILVALQVELGERGAATHRRVALVLADQAQHQRAHEWLVLVRDAGVGALGEARDGAVHAAGFAIGSECERVVLPRLPELEQRRGQQGQRARLALDVVHQSVGQPRLHPQPHAAGGQLDRTPQVRGLHGPDQHLVSAQQLGEPRVGGEAPVEVGSQRDHDDCATVRIGGGAGKRVGEGGALGVGAAGGEQLLELIDGEK